MIAINFAVTYFYIRQRGDVGGSMRKQGLRNKELERLYGIREGSAGKVSLDQNNSGLKLSQSDLAKQSNQSVDTWNNAKKLSIEDQEELLSSLPISEKLTQKQVQEYIEQSLCSVLYS